MKKLATLLFCLFLANPEAKAQNIILLIADGAGPQHLECTAKENSLFLKKHTPTGKIITRSHSHEITDSAASATAYACGLKTINGYLGMDKDKKSCQSLAEFSLSKEYKVIIRTSDVITGATPSAFYAHTSSRNNLKEITSHLKKASQQMDIKSVQHIDSEIKSILSNLTNKNEKFFLIVEESETDKQSHANNINQMKQAFVRFDNAVKEAYSFAQQNKNTTVIVLADHETGGLNGDCVYTSNSHTDTPILYYAFGQHASLFTEPVLDNTKINHKIKSILAQIN